MLSYFYKKQVEELKHSTVQGNTDILRTAFIEDIFLT